MLDKNRERPGRELRGGSGTHLLLALCITASPFPPPSLPLPSPFPPPALSCRPAFCLTSASLSLFYSSICSFSLLLSSFRSNSFGFEFFEKAHVHTQKAKLLSHVIFSRVASRTLTLAIIFTGKLCKF